MAYEGEQPARVERATAYQNKGEEYLLVTIKGKVPNACHVVRLERSILDVEPPTFDAFWWEDPHRVCTQRVKPYEHARLFHVGKRRRKVRVNTIEGELSVEVTDFPKSYATGPKGKRATTAKSSSRAKPKPRARAKSSATAKSSAKSKPRAKARTTRAKPKPRAKAKR